MRSVTAAILLGTVGIFTVGGLTLLTTALLNDQEYADLIFAGYSILAFIIVAIVATKRK